MDKDVFEQFVGKHQARNRSASFNVVLFSLLFLATSGGLAYLALGLKDFGIPTARPGGADAAEVKDLSLFDLSLPQDAVVARHVSVLVRERCDWISTANLANRLIAIKYSREAAKLYENYDAQCRSANNALYMAASIYNDLSDFDNSLRIIGKLSDTSDQFANFHFLHATVLYEIDRYQEAVDALYSTIATVPNLELINADVFFLLAKSHEALNEPCRAAEAIQSWVSIRPDSHSSPATDRMIRSYSSKGACREPVDARETLSTRTSGGVALVDVSINGQTGRFIIDTGAAFVSLTDAFAQKAGIRPRQRGDIVLQTANGVSAGSRAVLDRVSVGKISAGEVAGVILAPGASLGHDVDGLLGLSFPLAFQLQLFGRPLGPEVKDVKLSTPCRVFIKPLQIAPLEHLDLWDSHQLRSVFR